MLQPPSILSPIQNWEPTYNFSYYTGNVIQQISGDIPVPTGLLPNLLLTVEYSVQQGLSIIPPLPGTYSLAGIVAGATNPSIDDIAWSFNTEDYITLQEGSIVTIWFKAVEFTSQIGSVGNETDQSDPVRLVVNVVNVDAISASVSVPTGVTVKEFRDQMKILIPTDAIIINDNSSFLGCNFYLSLSPGGGSSGYQLMNDSYVINPDTSETQNTTVVDSTYTDEAGDLTIQTTKTIARQINYYTFTVDKDVLKAMVIAGTIPNVFLSDNTTLNDDIQYYFVTTAAAYDNTLTQAVESPYSVEINSSFIRYQTNFQSLPARRRPDILLSMAKRINANNDQINLVSGQVIRDQIDPVSDMFEKFYIVEDFVFTCESIDSLMQFDDANGDGVSDDPTTSLQKQKLADALNVTDPVVLQALIDEQFDKSAANFNLLRKPATSSTGSVTFFMTVRTTTDLLVQNNTIVQYPGNTSLNMSPVNFNVQGNYIFEAATIDNYYNASLKRYEIKAAIMAVNLGSAGNLPAGVITVVTNLDPRIQVENDVPTNYGSDQESNQSLGNRIKLARSSFDSGTSPGYLSTVYEVPGVLEVKGQFGGDPLMTRDYDADSKQHIGGKVDLYIRGSNISQVVDQLAFKFEYPSDVDGNKIEERFYVTDARDFRIKTTNPKVTSDSPIVIVNKVRNATRNKEYDLAGYQTLSDTIILNSSSQLNIAIGMATLDVIEVDYVYRSSNVLVLENQPILDVISVQDKDGNVIDASKYQTVQIEDPLKTGRSTIAKDGIEFLFTSSNDIAESMSISDEQHLVRLNSPAELNFKGVDLDSIVVKSSDNSIVYRNTIDYTVTLGTQTDYTYINLVSNGMIRSGDTISVDYTASTNLFVTYTYNSLMSQVQDKVNIMKHACADAIVKEAVENPIDLSFDIERDLSVANSNDGTTTDDENRLRSKIQTAIYNAVAGLKMGETLTQGYLVKTILSVQGVESVTTPFSIMMKRQGSFIPLDDLGYLSFEVFQRNGEEGITSYKSITSVLTYSTTDNGGPANLFRAVYEDMIELELVDDPTLVAKQAGSAYIMADGSIVVSTTDGRPPQAKHYTAAYYVSYPVGVTEVGDIKTSEIEYLVADSISFKGIDFTN